MLRNTPFAAVLLAICVSCAAFDPLLEHAQLEPAAHRLSRVALAPFGRESLAARDPKALASPALVARYLAEALQAEGIPAVAASDVGLALGAQGGSHELAKGAANRARLARLVSEDFGATALLTGSVFRFWSRSGSGAGSEYASSVGFELSLFAAPEGQLLWTGRFDTTQPALTDDPAILFSGFPGRGLRWARVEELAEWMARQAAREIRELE